MIETLFNILSHDRIQRVDNNQEANRKSDNRFSDHLKSDEPRKSARDDKNIEKPQDNNIERPEKAESKQPKEKADNQANASDDNSREQSSEKAEQSADKTNKPEEASKGSSDQSEKVEYKAVDVSDQLKEVLDNQDNIELASLEEVGQTELNGETTSSSDELLGVQTNADDQAVISGGKETTGVAESLLTNEGKIDNAEGVKQAGTHNAININDNTNIGPANLANVNQDAAKSATQTPTGLELSQKTELNTSPTAQVLKNIQREIQGSFNQNTSADAFGAATGGDAEGVVGDQQLFQDFTGAQDQTADQEALSKFKLGDLNNLGRFAGLANSSQNVQSNHLTNSASPQAIQVGQTQVSNNILTTAATNSANQQTQSVPVNALGLHIASQAKAGNKRFDIRLDPPELGRIDVRLDVGRDGAVNTHIVVERAETLDLLQRDAKALERAINDAGLDLKDGSLNFSLKDQSFAENMQDQDSSSQMSEEPGSDDQSVDQEIRNLANIPLQDGTVLGLDIRV